MKVVTFGEIMLRLAPEGYLRFTQADTFGVVYGGGEANVSVSLANYGIDSAFVTKLPKHDIGQAAVNSLRKFGVDTSMIVRGGDRVGIYFNEKGASQRPSKVIYDRAYSAIAMASPSDFDWEKIFEGADWFHFTGITPALNPTVAGICLDACRAAKANGVKITGGSCVKHEVAVQQIKRDVINKEDGETLGGVVRGPLSSNTPNGGFFFYVQHLVESVMEAFGRYPKSVQTFKTGGKDFVKGDALTIVFRYDNYDIIGVAEELGGSYYISRHSTYHVKGYEMMVTFDNPCFLKEFDEFHDIVKGADQRITYEDFIAPVFVMNAIKRSIDTGKECEVKTFEI